MSVNFPSADFAPTLSGYTGQGAFRFWCQKVLPLVYDDSLSYYELLAKVVQYLNNVIKDFGTMVDNLDEVLDAYKQLEDYVNNYLDLDAAVSKKIDQLVEDGIFTRAFGPLVELEVSQWLDEHPEATTTVQDGAITLRKLHKSLADMTVNDYVTPQMFGATGDGVADDTEAFISALEHEKVVVPNGSYNLSQILFSDDSKVKDYGSYISKPLVVSKDNQQNVKEHHTEAIDIDYTTLRIQSAMVYKNGYLLIFSDNTDCLLCYVSTEFGLISSVQGTYYHANDCTVKGTEIFIAPVHENGIVYVIDYDSLSFKRADAIMWLDKPISQISYDQQNDIFYVSDSDNISYITDSNFNLLKTLGNINQFFLDGYSYGLQMSNVIDSQFVSLLWVYSEKASGFMLCQYNYETGDPKCSYFYKVDAPWNEPECLLDNGTSILVLGYKPGPNNINIMYIDKRTAGGSTDFQYLCGSTPIGQNIQPQSNLAVRVNFGAHISSGRTIALASIRNSSVLLVTISTYSRTYMDVTVRNLSPTNATGESAIINWAVFYY